MKTFYTKSHERICQHDADYIVFADGQPAGTLKTENQARIFCAAPDLLAVCQELATYHPGFPSKEFSSLIKQARAAIAKAKGEA